MALLAGLGFRGEYPAAVEQELELLLGALKQAWLLDALQPGMTVMWFDDTLPEGFGWCRGGPVLRAENPVLWEHARHNITIFGQGDGATTFTLPDLTAISDYFIIRLG